MPPPVSFHRPLLWLRARIFVEPLLLPTSIPLYWTYDFKGPVSQTFYLYYEENETAQKMQRTYFSMGYRRRGMPSSVMWLLVALVRTEVSEKYIASITRVTSIGEPGTKLAVTSNRSNLRRTTNCTYSIFLRSVGQLLILLTLFVALRFLSPWWWRQYVPPKRPFLQQPYGVILVRGI
jgi:hypothetical protein